MSADGPPRKGFDFFVMLGTGLRTGVVAGEASGDLLAGLLLAGMQKVWPTLESAGIGGPRMQATGFHPWWPHHKLSVHGFGWDVLMRYREIVGIRHALRDKLLTWRPDLFVGVDAPDFNLDLERDLRRHGIRTVHFVSPSIWAWRPERVDKIRASADHVLCLFPFEPELLRQHGIGATYVGHPLAELISGAPDRSMARRHLGLADEDLVLAILPGSRKSEIRHLASRFFEAAALVSRAFPAIKIIVPVAPGHRAAIESAARRSVLGDSLKLLDGQSHAVLAACDVTLIASGTATLEAALFRKPMVIGYHMSALSWSVMQRKRLQPWVGLPNILCGEFVVPELLQSQASPNALAREIIDWVHDIQGRRHRVSQLEMRFDQLHKELHLDTSGLACHAIKEVLES